MKSVSPHITEKSYQGYANADKQGAIYTFNLSDRIDKFVLKRIIEKEYKVHVVSIRTIRIPGKVRRFKNILGRTNSLNKALVTLKKGERIAAFDVDTKDNQKKDSKS